MKKNFEDIIIFGSGLSAKTMSLVARNAGLSFKLITDKNISNVPSDDTRSLALSVASKKMLNTLGVNIKTEAVTKMIVIEGGLGGEKIKSKLPLRIISKFKLTEKINRSEIKITQLPNQKTHL